MLNIGISIVIHINKSTNKKYLVLFSTCSHNCIFLMT